MSRVRELLRAAYPARRVLVNRPRAAARSEYDDAERAYVDMVSALPAFRAVYRGGRIEHPGISDLDLVVVTAESLTAEQAAAFGAAGLPARHGYVHTHDPFPISEELFGDVTRSTTLRNLVRVAGRELAETPCEPDIAQRHRVVQLGAEIVLFLPREFVRWLVSEVLDVRLILMRLGSLRYPIAMARDDLGEALPRGEAFSKSVAALRERAIASEGVDEEELVSALEDAVDTSLELVDATAAGLEHAGLVEPMNEPAGRYVRQWYLDETYPTLFTGAWGRESSLATALALSARSGHLVSVLPGAFWPQIENLARGTGPVSRHVASRIRPDVGPAQRTATPEYAAAVVRGAGWLDARVSWLERNGFAFGYTHTHGWCPAASFRRRLRRSCREWVIRVAPPPRFRQLRRLPLLAEVA